MTRAFTHATNFTSGHETRSHLLGDRLKYPQDHIESDNRLSWFLGSLDREYGDTAHWVHLTRDEDQVVYSFLQRWEKRIKLRRTSLLRNPRRTARRIRRWWRDPGSTSRGDIAQAFAYDLLVPGGGLGPDQRELACRLYVRTVNDNISEFLDRKVSKSRVRVSEFKADFAALWDEIGAEGSIERALHELDTRHNRFAT